MAGDDGTPEAAGESGHPALPGPAPVIDLGGDAVPVRPAKPLGPRRLARLQRELAERSRELERSGGEPADPEVLEKQRRFAELAARAEAANVPSAGAPDGPEPVTPQPSAPEPAPTTPAPAGPGERITVVFPGADAPVGADGHVGHDPVHVDPSLFSNRLAPEELAALTHIEILAPGDHHGSHTAAPQVPGDPATAPEPAVVGPAPGEEPEPPAGPEPAVAGPAPGEEPEPPAAPVPATAAGGLELLEPREYRRPSGLRPLLLLLAVLAALAVVLVLFVP